MTGTYVDAYGRRFGCVVFCLLEIVINAMEHIPSIEVLFIGRILGGISTNLLFSAFEAWMVAEHRKMKFDENSLMSTFSIASWGNGVMAIGAGFIAQYSVTNLGQGDIGPFQVAIALTIVCLVLILLWWDENYGSSETAEEVSKSMEPNVSYAVSKAIEEDTSFKISQARSMPGKTRSRARTPSSRTSLRPETPTRRSSRVKKTTLVDNDEVSSKVSSPRHKPKTKASGNPVEKLGLPHTEICKKSSTAGSSTAEEPIWAILQRHPEIWLLGLSQACFEGAVYSFGKSPTDFLLFLFYINVA